MTRKDGPHREDLGDVRISFDGYWIWLLSKRKPPYPITGKYLFFSEHPEQLREIALAEIRGHGFHHAKYNPVPLEGGRESVLCLYYHDDSRKYELAKRARAYRVKYRYWKSDEDTLEGRYSETFLQRLSPEARKAFARNRADHQNASAQRKSRKERDGPSRSARQ